MAQQPQPRLRGITWDHPRGYDPLVACSAVYAEEVGIQVQWERRSLKDFGDLPIDQLAQAYDLLIIDHPHVGLAASSGCLLPLEQWLSAESLAHLAAASAGPSHASYDYAGSQWGLAVDAAMQVAVCRAEALDALPGTWDAVLGLAGELRRRGRWMVTPLCPTDAICSFLTLCANLGSPIGSPIGSPGSTDWVERDIGLHALELLAAIGAASHPLSLSANPIAVLDAMAAEADLVYCPLSFCYTNYARTGFRPALLRFGPIPDVRGSLLGGAGIGVSAFTPEPGHASHFAAWVCGDAVQNGPYVRHGGQPGNRTPWLDAEANLLTHDFFRCTLPALEHAYVRPRYAGFVTFQEHAGRIINAFLHGRTNPVECLDLLEGIFLGSRPAGVSGRQKERHDDQR